MQKETLLNSLKEEGFIGKSNIFLGIENKRWSKAKKKRFKELTDILVEFTNYLPETISLKERRYFLEHLDKDTWKCQFPGCNASRKYTNFKWGFSKICNCSSKEHLDFQKKLMVSALEETMQNKHGVKNCSALPKVKLKKAQTFEKNYNTSNIFRHIDFIKNHPQNIFFDNLIYNKLSVDYIQNNFIVNNTLDIKKVMSDLGCAKTTAYQIVKRYNINYKKRSGTSVPEQEIIDYIKELIPNVIIDKNTRYIIPPKELDIYLPEYNLAIEYNGLMFHSQGTSKFSMLNTPTKDKNIHLSKTQSCRDQDIQLLHINENEWLCPRTKEIWKSVIRNKLNLNSNKIGARKCTFATKEQLLQKSKSFIEENHLQGSGAIGSIRYGLLYNDELVSLMTFSKARFDKKPAYELIRFVNKRDWTVSGAASKLLKAFEREHAGLLISYANCRWSDGGLYKQLDFNLEHTSKPNFYVFHPRDTSKLWHRVSFQKHKLKEKLDYFDPKQTAEWNIFQNGYRKIYDSGNYVFKKYITVAII